MNNFADEVPIDHQDIRLSIASLKQARHDIEKTLLGVASLIGSIGDHATEAATEFSRSPSPKDRGFSTVSDARTAKLLQDSTEGCTMSPENLSSMLPEFQSEFAARRSEMSDVLRRLYRRVLDFKVTGERHPHIDNLLNEMRASAMGLEQLLRQLALELKPALSAKEPEISARTIHELLLSLNFGSLQRDPDLQPSSDFEHEVAADLNAAASGLQIGDITCQRIEHMVDALEGASGFAAADLNPILLLAADQLADSASDFRERLAAMLSHLFAGVAQVEAAEKDIRSISPHETIAEISETLEAWLRVNGLDDSRTSGNSTLPAMLPLLDRFLCAPDPDDETAIADVIIEATQETRLLASQFIEGRKPDVSLVVRKARSLDESHQARLCSLVQDTSLGAIHEQLQTLEKHRQSCERLATTLETVSHNLRAATRMTPAITASQSLDDYADAIFASYTMNQEREVHARHFAAAEAFSGCASIELFSDSNETRPAIELF